MVKKMDIKLITTIVAVLGGALMLIAGIIFYATFEQPMITVVIPELDALFAWTAVSMVLSALIIVIAVVNHLVKKAEWTIFILIFMIVLTIILEVALVILLFRNIDLVSSSAFLLILSFLAISAYIVSTVFSVMQVYSKHIKAK